MKKAIIILSALAVIGIAAFVFLSKRGPTIEYSTAKVESGDIVQTVSETGTIKAIREIDLSFGNTGDLVELNAEIGDKVTAGMVLARIDASDLDIKLSDAEASLNYARANLNKIQAGASSEDIAVSRASEQQARISYEAAQSELTKTKASVSESITQAEKSLNDLLDTTSYTLTTYEQSISSAQTTLVNTKSTYGRTIENKTDVAIVAVRSELPSMISALDAVNNIIEDDDADGHLSVKDESYLTKTILDRKNGLVLIQTAQSKLDAAVADQTNENVLASLDAALAALAKTLSALNNCFTALDMSVDSSSFSLAQINTYKSGINTQLGIISAGQSSIQNAKLNLNDAILNYNTNVSTAEQSLMSAQAAYENAVINARNTLSSAKTNGDSQIVSAEARVNTAMEAWNVAKSQLQKTLAPARTQDITLYQAQVAQAQSAVESVRNQIEKSVIKSPIDGTVTKVEFEVGEQVPATKAMISVLGQDNYDVEVDISEADIAKIKQDNPAMITLDAYGDEVKFYGKVMFIEPAETVIQDVIYYKVKISFAPEGYEIKPGMTANITVTTAEKPNVLMVPSRAVIERNGDGNFVRKMVNGQPEEVKIETGLRGDDGVTEVIAGLSENDMVVTSSKEVK